MREVSIERSETDEPNEIKVFIETEQEKHMVFTVAPAYGIRRYPVNPDPELNLDDGNRVIIL